MEQKLEKYVYHDIELTDESVISYYKQSHYLQKLENKLLGDFDKNGKYKISEPVLKELANIHKVIEKTEDGKMTATAKVNKFKFNFEVVVGDIDHETKYASLKLIEEFCLFKGDKKTLICTPVVYYKDANNQYFDDKILKLFNLHKKDESEGKEFDNGELAKLIIKAMAVSDATLKSFIKQTRSKDKLYVLSMLKVFEVSGKFGEFALRRYNALLKEYASVLNPKDDNYYHILKQIIDKIMMEEEKSVSKETALLIQKLRAKYVKTIDNFIEVVIKNPPKKVVEKPIVLKGDGGTVHTGTAFKETPSKKSAPRKTSLIQDFGRPQTQTNTVVTDVKPVETQKSEQKVETFNEQWDMDIKDYIKQMESLNQNAHKDTLKEEIETLQNQTDIIMGPTQNNQNQSGQIKSNQEQTFDFG